MTLEDGIKLQGTPAIIQDCLRADLPKFFKNHGLEVGAEIGVYKGAFSELFCQAGLNKVYSIDPWMSYDGAGRTQKVQDRQNFLFEHTQRVLAPYPNSEIIRKASLDALADFEDESLDWVYIDGNHDFRHIAADVYEWSRKVRSGGVVSGHDYFDTSPTSTNLLCHVRVVVDAYTRLFQIPNWWLFGQQRLRPGSSFHVAKDDRYYSWMWFKP